MGPAARGHDAIGRCEHITAVRVIDPADEENSAGLAFSANVTQLSVSTQAPIWSFSAACDQRQPLHRRDANPQARERSRPAATAKDVHRGDGSPERRQLPRQPLAMRA